MFQQQASTMPMMNPVQQRLWNSFRLWKLRWSSMLLLLDISQEWLHRQYKAKAKEGQ